MAVFKHNLTIYQGSTLSKQFTWKTGPAGEETPVDLTGCTARMQIRRTVAAAVAEADLTTENGGIVLGGAAGTIDITIDAEDTAAFDFTKGVYDLEIVFGGDVVHRKVEGSVTVKPEVTR